ncbi:MAG: sulfatase [bacterium]|nr:sulfatase [bacterium]
MADKRPDVLLIILDTTRRDRLSSYGYPRQTSPHFDTFAQKATLFERAIAPAQWTVPSHASMFTGVYPSTHQLTQAGERLSGSYPTLAEILQVEGYRTAAFCNNPLVGVLDNGLQRGFGEFYNYAGAAPNRPDDLHKSQVRKAVARRWRRFASRVSNTFAHSDWMFRTALHPRFAPLWTRYINYKGDTARSIDDLIGVFSQHRAGGRQQPLFAFLNLMGAHMPYHPPQDYLDRFAPEISRDPAALRFMRSFNADAARWASPTDPPLTEWQQAVIDGFYTAEVAYQDYHLGRLLNMLRTSGALDDTLVLITADHGEGHGDHQFFGHSFVVYQELVHVPLAIHYPDRFPAGIRATTNISTRRIFHTVLESVGIRPPLDEADPNANISGLTLARATNGVPDIEGGLVFAEAFPPMTMVKTIQHRAPALIERLRLTQVRRGVYLDARKLAVVGGQAEGYFDLQDDPSEMHDLSGQHSAEVAALQAIIGQFVAAAQQQRPESIADAPVSEDVLDNLRALGYIE